MVYRIFKLILALCIFSSCGFLPPKWSKTATGGRQAVSKEYSLSKQKFAYNTAIDTNSVYIAENYYVLSNYYEKKIAEEKVYYDFMRFSGQGILFKHTLMNEKPCNEDFNLMQGGQYCFYNLKDSTLKLERYNFDTNVFEYWYGKIQDNGDIYFYNSRGRPFGTYTQPLKLLFRKTPANLSTKIIFPE